MVPCQMNGLPFHSCNIIRNHQISHSFCSLPTPSPNFFQSISSEFSKPPTEKGTSPAPSAQENSSALGVWNWIKADWCRWSRRQSLRAKWASVDRWGVRSPLSVFAGENLLVLSVTTKNWKILEDLVHNICFTTYFTKCFTT